MRGILRSFAHLGLWFMLAVLAGAPLAQAADSRPPPSLPAVNAPVEVAPLVQASSWKPRLDLTASQLAPSLGQWVARDALPGITWLQVVLCGVVVLAVGIGERSLHALMRRQIRRQSEQVERRATPLGGMFKALLAPLALLIWVWGSYAGLAILLANFAGAASQVQAALTWLLKLGNAAALFWLVFRLIDVAEAQLGRWADKAEGKWNDIIASVAGRTLRWITPLIALIMLLPTLNLSAGTRQFMSQSTSVLLILAIGFILGQLVDALEVGARRRFRVDVKDNLSARRIRTQFLVLKKVAFVVIGIFTLALALMEFPAVRHLGTSLLASAGLAGIVLGFAAQKSLGTLIAGLQLAITQPIRIDDVVIVENEWGRIEEIALTYVVVRLWDLRRLVVPTGYFLEKPFQNWTRASADLLGAVTLYVDYTVPLAAMRDELERILSQSPLWDGKVKQLQVTDARERSLELRALVSAADASALSDLRSAVREALVDFLQRNYPQCLPRTRMEVDSHSAAGAAAERAPLYVHTRHPAAGRG